MDDTSGPEIAPYGAPRGPAGASDPDFIAGSGCVTIDIRAVISSGLFYTQASEVGDIAWPDVLNRQHITIYEAGHKLLGAFEYLGHGRYLAIADRHG